MLRTVETLLLEASYEEKIDEHFELAAATLDADRDEPAKEESDPILVRMRELDRDLRRIVE